MPGALFCFRSAALELLALSLLLIKLALQLCKWIHCRLWRRLSLPFRELFVVLLQLQAVDFPYTVKAPTLRK